LEFARSAPFTDVKQEQRMRTQSQ